MLLAASCPYVYRSSTVGRQRKSAAVVQTEVRQTPLDASGVVLITLPPVDSMCHAKIALEHNMLPQRFHFLFMCVT